MNNTAASKRLEQLRTLVPGVAKIWLLLNTRNPNAAAEASDIEAAARALGQQIWIGNASNEAEIDAAFSGFVQAHIDALLVAADALFTARRDQVIALAARHAIPATYGTRLNVPAGGLMSYGADYTDPYRQTGLYCGRIRSGRCSNGALMTHGLVL